MNLRKIFFYTGLVILILAAVTVGGYHYILNRYAGEMDKLIDIFLTEMQEEESQKEQEKESTGNNTEESKDNVGENSSKTPGKDPGQNETSKAGDSTPSPGTINEPGTSASGPAKENPSDGEKLKELEEKYTPALKNIELKDQLFTIQILRKFSAAELQEMYRLYTAGGKSRNELLKKLQEKVTPEEMQRIKEIFQKNKCLL